MGLDVLLNWLEILTAWQSSKTSSDSDPNLTKKKKLQARQRTVSITSGVVVKFNLLSLWSKAYKMMSLYKSLMSLCNQQFDCLLDFFPFCVNVSE